jgi:hypothetical protein
MPLFARLVVASPVVGSGAAAEKVRRRAYPRRMRRNLRVYALVLSLLALVTATAWAGLPNAPDPKPTVTEQARIDAATKTFALVEIQYQSGASSADAVYLWSTRWLHAQLEVGTASKKGRHDAAADHLARMKKLATSIGKSVAAGIGSKTDGEAAKYYVAEAELWAAQNP